MTFQVNQLTSLMTKSAPGVECFGFFIRIRWVDLVVNVLRLSKIIKLI